MEENLTYKGAISELESILAKMENNQCDIDQLTVYTSRALELLKFCRQRLHDTDTEVMKCLSELQSALTPGGVE
ncbi:MAG: exodeoxyribonuclease VII small subunit [Muribaculaceae bacterium]|nr:exodeoxyribonuclease VII small subunit [Bacteroidales bacterium]MDD6701229.1 exodeoxyribonuclease VII small subunit [Bacteroidales bacterium]MDD6943054.1 exodeoxyribonuclease VII small subunit [Bacteroidales bacterium]MDY2734042.1 exodeoxyribonuclease VII small subunit [Muribaculaceae bacterium]MDY4649850.1 exodeoxyribonuclease VII small subunit [Muribaculaceae bacterium]